MNTSRKGIVFTNERIMFIDTYHEHNNINIIEHVVDCRNDIEPIWIDAYASSLTTDVLLMSR
jgi:hypothetical protein